jgi:hypothetical protein
MLQLNPLEDFTIARGLEDHTDNTTYYVRAVVRNAKTDSLIATVTLDDKGDGHRFSKKWQVPADQTGQGFYILITTSVYTDSGYTTKTPNYGDKYETYLVQDRLNRVIDVPQIDYKGLETMMKRQIEVAFAKLPEPIDPTKLPKVDLAPVLSAISGVKRDIAGIELPEQPELDLNPILSEIRGARSDIRSIEIPTPDFSGIEERLNILEDKMDVQELAKLKGEMDDLFARIKQFFGNDMDQMNEKMDKLSKEFKNIAYIALQTNSKNNEE